MVLSKPVVKTLLYNFISNNDVSVVYFRKCFLYIYKRHYVDISDDNNILITHRMIVGYFGALIILCQHVTCN